MTQEERSQLEALTRSGKTAASKFVHARALLLCDAGPHRDPWKVAGVVQGLGVTTRTIEHLKERFVEEGIEAALERKAGLHQTQIQRGLASFTGIFEHVVHAWINRKRQP